MARPLDARLVRSLPGLRRHLAATALGGAAAGALVIAQADLLSRVLADGFAGRGGALVPLVAGLAGVVAARSALAWAREAVAHRGAAAVKADLRTRLLARTAGARPAWLVREEAGKLTTLIGRGLDAIDPYLTGYLPQLVTAMLVPLAVVARLAFADWSSALIIAVTLPLVPIFGVLVGGHTRTVTERRWRALARLGGHFLDVIAGLPTLLAFGRAKAQADVVRRVADAHRQATMRTLRVAFLSALVLELAATLSVALVAVPIGLRLLSGGLDLRTALLVLFLAPEAYLPLRALGQQFHVSMEGVAVAKQAFAVLDRTGDAETRWPRRATPDPAKAGITLDRVTVRYAGRDRPALEDVSLVVRPGERIGLVGPSGAGKSTLLALLLGLVTPSTGRALVGGVDIERIDIEAWRRRSAWVPQRPHLFAASVVDNIRLGRPDASMAEVRRAARAASADGFVAGLPDGYDTMLGERGTGLSAGQRQRVALARAFLRDAPLLLLDEPTARLDVHSERAVAEATERLMAGRTAIIVAHRPALVARADRIVRLEEGRAAVDLTEGDRVGVTARVDGDRGRYVFRGDHLERAAMGTMATRWDVV